MNVFFVEKNTLYTPPLHGTILPGITRDSVIQVARDLGLDRSRKLRSRSMKRQRKFEAGRITEVFACGTAAVVIGNQRIDFRNRPPSRHRQGASGEVTRKLNTELQGIQFGRLPDRHGWIEIVVSSALHPAVAQFRHFFAQPPTRPQARLTDPAPANAVTAAISTGPPRVCAYRGSFVPGACAQFLHQRLFRPVDHFLQHGLGLVEIREVVHPLRPSLDFADRSAARAASTRKVSPSLCGRD